MPRTILPLPLLLLLLAPAGPSGSVAASAESSPDRHEVRLRLDPESGTLVGRDRLATDWRRTLSFELRPELELGALRCGELDLLSRLRPARSPEAAPGRRELRLPRSCADEDGRALLELEYRGLIRDEPTAEVSLHFVTGDSSTGIISEKGAFLTGGSGHHADLGGLALFDLLVDVPAGWAVASQGRVVEPQERPEPGRALFAFEAELPTDGLALSAGPYRVRERRHGEILVRTFFFSDDEERSDLFLDAVVSYLDRFEEMLGPYPHSKFDVVENFFTTGYGFPGYTLLGQDVIAMGPRALRPGYVDHEVAHCWWGNGVFVDPEGGNWCEGLTTYVANYMGAESQGAEEARLHRQRVSQRYAIDVPTEADFPPSDFRWKEDEAGASIGYGKVSMIFHQLRRELGEEAFWSGLKELVKRELGKQASWNEIRTAFEAVSGRDLGVFFRQWVERAGLPHLSLAELKVENGVTSGVVLQDGESWDVEAELELRLADGGSLRESLELSGPRTPFRFATPEPVLSVELDPGWHLPREISTADLPHGLSRTLAAKRQGHELFIAYPTAPPEGTPKVKELARAYRELAEAAAEQHGGRALPALAVAEAEWESGSFLLLGGPEENLLTRRVLDELFEAGFDPTGEGFRAGTRRWLEPTDSLLASIPHPLRAGASITAWIPNAPEAMASSRYLFFYGWDSWVALRSGRAVERGTLWPENSATRKVLAKAPGPTDTAARLRRTVEQLTRSELEGRPAGTDASRRTAHEIAEAMRSAGLAPWDPRGYQHLFHWFLQDLPRQPVLFVDPRGGTSRSFPCTPAAYWLPVPPTMLESPTGVELVSEPVMEPVLVPFPEGLVWAGNLRRPALQGLDLRGAATVILDDSALPAQEDRTARARYEEERIEAYFALLPEVRRRGGESLIVIRPRDEAPYFPAMATFPSLDGGRDPRLAAAFERGGRAELDRTVSGLLSRVGPPPSPVRLAFAGSELLEALRAEGELRPGRRYWQGTYTDLRMRLFTERLHDRNLVGLTAGARRLSEGLVLVGAHHDGVGHGADGSFRQGAVDNAAGVAVLLELARRFSEDPPLLTVAFASYGAEEWGLVGSRSLAMSWPGHWPIRAVVNVDSVGGRGAELHVIGASREPELAETILSAARERGIAVGPDIDRHADRHGSDHWPWVEKGVPAVGLFQADYKTLNGPEDRVEQVDFDALAELVEALEVAIRRLSGEAAS